jgi:hypothetical protein
LDHAAFGADRGTDDLRNLRLSTIAGSSIAAMSPALVATLRKQMLASTQR